MVLVIGATGTVGTHAVRQLIEAGERPRVFVRDIDKARQHLGNQVDFVAGDLNCPATIPTALAGVDRVLLVTATTKQQFAQERNVILAAQRAGVDHLVKLSVLGSSEWCPLEHGRWQAALEELLKTSGVDYTILQLAFFMQNFISLGVVQHGTIATSAENGRIGMVDARDVALVATTALRQGSGKGETLVLTGPDALTFDDVAQTLSTVTRRRFQHVQFSSDELRELVRMAHPEQWYVDDVVAFNAMIASGQIDVVTGDVYKMTGRKPRTLETFARDHCDALAELAM